MLIHRGLSEVLGSLAEIGYDAEWQDIRAEDMGAPHKRERIWIVAYPNESRLHELKKGIRQECSEFIGENINTVLQKVANPPSNRRSRKGTQGQIEKGLQQKPEHSRELENGPERCGDVSDPDSQGLQRRQKTGDIEKSREGRKQQFERQSKFPGGQNWPLEPSVGRLVNGLPNRVDRLKCLGNSIVPQIAEILFKLIKDKL